MQDYQRQFIDFLTECGAFKLGSFTLKSSRVSPTPVRPPITTTRACERMA